jgi:hypothetical protein
MMSIIRNDNKSIVSLRNLSMAESDKRRRGRPKAPRIRAHFNFRAFPEWTEWLRATAQEVGIDSSDIIAEGVKLWARKHKAPPPPER